MEGNKIKVASYFFILVLIQRYSALPQNIGKKTSLNKLLNSNFVSVMYLHKFRGSPREPLKIKRDLTEPK